MSVYCFTVHWIPLWSLSYFIHTWTLGSTYYFHFTDEEGNWSSGNENVSFKITSLVVRGLGHKTRSFQPQSYILLLHLIVVQPLTCLLSLFFLLLVQSYPNLLCYIHVELFAYSLNTILLLKLLPLRFHPWISFSSLPPWKASTHLYNPGEALPPLPDIPITFHLYEKKNFYSHEWHWSIFLFLFTRLWTDRREGLVLFASVLPGHTSMSRTE